MSFCKRKLYLTAGTVLSTVLLGVVVPSEPAYSKFTVSTSAAPSVEVHLEALEALRGTETFSLKPTAAPAAIEQAEVAPIHQVEEQVLDKSVPTPVEKPVQAKAAQTPKKAQVPAKDISETPAALPATEVAEELAPPSQDHYPIEQAEQAIADTAEPVVPGRTSVIAPTANNSAEVLHPITVESPAQSEKPEEAKPDTWEFITLDEDKQATQPAEVAPEQAEDSASHRLPVVVKKEATEQQVDESKEIIAEKSKDKRTLLSMFKNLPFVAHEDQEAQHQAEPETQDEYSAESADEAQHAAVAAAEPSANVTKVPSLPDRHNDKVAPSVTKATKEQDNTPLVYIPSFAKTSDKPIEESESSGSIFPWKRKAEQPETLPVRSAEASKEVPLIGADEEQKEHSQDEEKREEWFASLKNIMKTPSFLQKHEAEEVPQALPETPAVAEQLPSTQTSEVQGVYDPSAPVPHFKPERTDNKKVTVAAGDEKASISPKPERKPEPKPERKIAEKKRSQRVPERVAVVEAPVEQAAPVAQLPQELPQEQKTPAPLEHTDTVLPTPITPEVETAKQSAPEPEPVQIVSPVVQEQPKAIAEQAVEPKAQDIVPPTVAEVELPKVQEESKPEVAKAPQSAAPSPQREEEKFAWKNWMPSFARNAAEQPKPAANTNQALIERTIVKTEEGGKTVEYSAKEVAPLPKVADVTPTPSAPAAELQKQEEEAPTPKKEDVASNAAPIPQPVAITSPVAVAVKPLTEAKSDAQPVPETAEQLAALPPAAAPAQPKENPTASVTPVVVPSGAALLSIEFHNNDISISDADKSKLAELVHSMADHNSQRIKVVSYAKGIENQANSARRISLQRAIAIRSQLIQSGLDSVRINVQAAGDKVENPTMTDSAQIFLVEGSS